MTSDEPRLRRPSTLAVQKRARKKSPSRRKAFLADPAAIIVHERAGSAATETGHRAVNKTLVAFRWKDFDFVGGDEFSLKIVVHLEAPNRGYT